MIAELLAALGRGSVQWLWSPVLAWTIAGVAIMGALTLMRGMHPTFGYRLRQAVLLSLPITVLLGPSLGRLVPSHVRVAVLPTVQAVQRSMAPAAPTGTVEAAGRAFLDPVAMGFGVATLLAALIAAVGLLALFVRVRQVKRLAAVLEPIRDATLTASTTRLRRELGVERDVLLRLAPPGSVPMTFSWRRPVVAVPVELCDDPVAFELAVAHEMVHVRRADYAWGIAERFVSAVFAFHPLVWIVDRSVQHFREASCDSEVLASGAADPRTYAEMLLELSSRPVPAPLLAAGITSRTSRLKKRLETMTRFIDAPTSNGRSRRSAIAAGALLLVVTLAGACIGGQERHRLTAEEARAFEAMAITSRFSPMADETRQDVLRRLDVQMEYLTERIEETRSAWQEREARGEQHLEHVYEQLNLLNSMFMQRLEIYETLRLEAATERILAETR